MVARGARRGDGSLAAEPDGQARRRIDQRVIRAGPMRRDDPESVIRRTVGERDPLVVAIAAVEAVASND